MDLVNIFESQKMSFNLHRSTTYENSYKMTTSEVMLWCGANDNLVKIMNFIGGLGEIERLVRPP